MALSYSCKNSTQPTKQVDCPNAFLPCEDDVSECCEVICDDGYHLGGQDSTECLLDFSSHQFEWFRVDTVAISWSFLRSVDIIDENNVWIGGDVRIEAETGTEYYEAIYWDGENYNYLTPADFPDTPYNFTSIWAVNNNDVWLCDVGAARLLDQEWVFYNGINSNLVAGGHIMDMEGTASDNLWLVSDGGVASHFNGIDFENHYIGDYNFYFARLTDNDFYTLGSQGYQNGPSAVFQYNGTAWQSLLYEEDIFPDYQNGDFGQLEAMDVWGDTLYVTSRGGFIKYSITDSVITSSDWYTPHPDTSVEEIKVMNPNDIFIFGEANWLTHFNGETWAFVYGFGDCNLSIYHADINDGYIVIIGRVGDLQTGENVVVHGRHVN